MCQTGRQDIFILFLTVPDAVWDLREIVKAQISKKMHPLLQLPMLYTEIGSGEKEKKRKRKKHTLLTIY